MAHKGGKTSKEVNRAYYQRRKAEISDRAKRRRKECVAQTILVDCKRSDKKKRREFDLDLAFVQELIAAPCSYCGETLLRMCLDRVDNALGHTRTNVVAACERCNMMRRDMPYPAWLVLVPAVRAARESGLFGAWVGSPHRRMGS